MKYLCLVAALLLVAACSSDDNNSPIETEEETTVIDPGFYGLAIGNSWSYQAYQRGSTTDDPIVYNPIEISWTVTITDTVTIDGEQFFERTFNAINETGFGLGVFPPSGMSTDRVRDSLGYLIDENGFIWFSSQLTTPYLLSSQPFGDVYGELIDESTTVTVEAGSFVCDENEIYAYLNPDGERSPGTSRYYFAEGIGAVQLNVATVSFPVPLFRIDLTDYVSITD